MQMIEVPNPNQRSILWAHLLSRQYRYSGEQGLSMINRPNLYTHSTRVLHLAQHLLEVLDIVDGEEFPVDELKTKRMTYLL